MPCSQLDPPPPSSLCINRIVYDISQLSAQVFPSICLYVVWFNIHFTSFHLKMYNFTIFHATNIYIYIHVYSKWRADYIIKSSNAFNSKWFIDVFAFLEWLHIVGRRTLKIASDYDRMMIMGMLRRIIINIITTIAHAWFILNCKCI